jgi:hypothetical protein
VRRIDITSAKINIVFREGQLPTIDPDAPDFVLVMGGFEIRARCNAKAARKLASWAGGAVLQGKLVSEGGALVLLDAGFTWIEPKPGRSDDGGGLSGP